MNKGKAVKAAFGVGAFVATAIVATPTAANAVPCQISKYVTQAADYARTTDASGGCSSVWAEHLYDPVWSGSNYWTSRVFGGNVAQSPSTAELLSGGHGGSGS